MARKTSRPSPESLSWENLVGPTTSPATPSVSPEAVRMLHGSRVAPDASKTTAVATAPVPHAKVSVSTPRSYVLMAHSPDRRATKFTLAPADPRDGWLRRVLP